MQVIFRSRDFASVESAGFGFNNRRPMTRPWQYQGRVQHRQWQGRYECLWERDAQTTKHMLPEILWTVYGDARLFGLAAALKARGFVVDVLPDSDAEADNNNNRTVSSQRSDEES